MRENKKGITLVSLVITVAVILIVSTSIEGISYNRLKINQYNKLMNDLDLLNEKISNYYLKYERYPVLKNGDSEITYTYLGQECYILDLKEMENLSLNYGKDYEEIIKDNGIDLENKSDIYVFSKKTNNIYYVKGIELNGEIYHNKENKNILDTVPPTKPKIKEIIGVKDKENNYSEIKSIEFVPGNDGQSGVESTKAYIVYKENEIESEIEILNIKNNIILFSNIEQYTDKKDFSIKIVSIDNNNNTSEELKKNIKYNKENEIWSIE